MKNVILLDTDFENTETLKNGFIKVEDTLIIKFGKLRKVKNGHWIIEDLPDLEVQN